MARNELYRAAPNADRTGKVLALDANGVCAERDLGSVERCRRVSYFEDFLGATTIGISGTGDAAGGPLQVKDTSAAGTPTYVIVADAADGHLKLAFDSQNEAQVLTLFFNDELNIPAAKAPEMLIRLKTVAEAGAALDSATKLAFGFASAQNDTLDTVGTSAWFRLEGSQALLLESDNTSADVDDKSAGVTLTDATFYEFRIDMSDYTNVKFYYRTSVGGQWLRLGSAGSTFAVNSTNLQPFIQFQKGADTNTDAVTIDYIQVSWDRT